MNTYIITDKENVYADTPVFYAGPRMEQEAIALFTSRQRAEHYLAETDWSKTHTVGALKPVQALRWLQTASDDGVDLLTIDPGRGAHAAGIPQRVWSLEDPLNAFANLLQSLRRRGSVERN